MKANEFRLGNLVLWSNEIVPIDLISNDDVNVIHKNSITGWYTVNITDIEPVLLTEKILLNAGFILNSNQFELNEIVVQLDTHTTVLIADDPYCSHEVKQKKQFVHQLQNLYFVLKGEELEIKIQNPGLDDYLNKKVDFVEREKGDITFKSMNNND